MRFGVNSLVWVPVDPVTGRRPTEHQRIWQAIRLAELAEDFGFDAVGFGEHHYGEFAGSYPFTYLAALAMRTSRVKLLTGVMAMSWHNAVRVAEDLATVDHISDGRVGIITARGANPRSNEVLGVESGRTSELQMENYELLRKLLDELHVDWDGTAGLPLRDVTSIPRPYQQNIPVWHGTSQNLQIIDRAIEHRDGIFIPFFFSKGSTVADVRRQYPSLAKYYREQWYEKWGTLSGSSIGLQTTAFVRQRSQDAWNEFRPYYDGQRIPGAPKDAWQPPLEDLVAAGTILVGSPEEVLDQLGGMHDAIGQDIQLITFENRGELFGTQVECMEEFASLVMPFAQEKFGTELWSTPPAIREPYVASDAELVDGHRRGA